MATRTKHYEADLKDLDHLLQIIESEMGPDAQLETQEYTKGGVMGIGGRRMISITATVEVNPQRIGSGIRRTIRLDDNWTVGMPENPAEAEPPKEEEKLIDLSQRRSTIPTGGNIMSQPPARRPRPVQPEPEPEPEPVVQEAAAAPEPEAVQSAVSAPAPAPVVHEERADEVVYTTPAPEPEPVAAEPEPEPVVIQAAPEPELEAATAPTAPEPETWSAPDIAAQLAASQSDLEEIVEIREAVERLTQGLEDEVVAMSAVVVPAEPLVSAAELQRASVGHEVFDRLVDWNIRSADAYGLIQQGLTHYAPDAEPSADGLFGVIVNDIVRGVRTLPGLQVRAGQRRVVALVGGTGSGKTSLAAKLAARYAYERDLRVALISMDTYRIAAVDQLRTFADIMGFPLSVAYTPEEYAQQADSLDADLVLVDTAGRSPLNTRQLDELHSAFAARWPDEVHIALPATTRADDLALMLEAFAPARATAAIVTKLDETRSLGALHNLTQLGGPPVSFFSTGQAIPEDLHEALPGFLHGWAESLGYGS